MIFAREVSDPLTSLVKKIDAATAKNHESSMGSFIVFLNDDEGLEKTLKGLAEKEKLEHIVLTLETNKSGPPKYKIAEDADVTVVLYTKGEVKANYAFKKGELKDKDIEKIVDDVKKILPEKK
jgi:predicted transcriptional regulator